MKKEYWDNAARSFEDQIFSVFDNDTSGLISAALLKYSSKEETATDIGCGIGSFLPLMSQHFANVVAIDISPKVLQRARSANSRLENVSFRTADLSRPGLRLPRAAVCLCVNVLLTPSLGHRMRMLDRLCGHIRPGGHLILVVPSLESAMLTHQRLIEWNIKDGLSPSHAVTTAFPVMSAAEAARLRRGIVNVDSVPHKHYLKEEACHELAQRNMDVVEAGKITYPWTTEFTEPPPWMKAPYPWDWFIVAKKKV
jgi:SAM-dependent methyltransferase